MLASALKLHLKLLESSFHRNLTRTGHPNRCELADSASRPIFGLDQNELARTRLLQPVEGRTKSSLTPAAMARNPFKGSCGLRRVIFRQGEPHPLRPCHLPKRGH